MNRLAQFVFLVCAALAGALKADAQPVTTLYSFVRGPINPHAGLTLGPDGNFYGTTAAGGRNLGGTVFRMTTDGALTTLFSFNGYPSGSGPTADLTLGPDGNFYGTTMAGGTTLTGVNDTGVVFKMNTNGIPTTVVNFNGTNGGHPDAAVILGPDGCFYGTTEFSGSNNVGTVFKVTTNGMLTTLVAFNTTNGANPVSCLTLAPGGTFYGTTKFGGKFGLGTAFKLTTNGDFTMLNNFDQTNGAWPAGRMALGPDGNLYGTTAYIGTAFEMTTNGAVTTLYDFNNSNGTNGQFPYSGLTLGPDGNFYGTTSQGGTNGSGTIFQVSTNGTLAMLALIPGIQFQTATNPQGYVYVSYTTNNWATSASARVFNGTLTTLYGFSALVNSYNGDGADPESDLTLGPDGNFYGTTLGGGTNGAGAVFKISTNGTFTALASFAGNTGYNPYAGVTAGPGGSLYGVVKFGGTTGYGTAYKVSATGQFTLLHNFSYFPDGGNPQATLIQGTDGNFYGTAVGGGTNLLQTGPNSYQAESFGTVFKLATNGTFTPLAYFNGTNGANPYGGLAFGPDGSFYGTTAYGGISNNGVVFRLLTNGTMTALTNFTGANGANPYGGLTLGLDGNFYGTCEAGGTNGNGTVFQVTTNGALTTLVYFDGTNGANPNAGVTLGPDGGFYGTAYGGNFGHQGTVFKITTSGALTTLVNFAQTNGSGPVAGLALGPDGNFYGATSLGGVNNYQGTLFKITTNGTLTTLYSFAIPNGSAPFAALTLQTNSHFINFYGTTFGDGGDHPGTVFRVNLTTSYSITENTTETFSPLTNDVVWTTGGFLGLLTAVATNGTAQISGSGIVFTPATNFTGTATINYTVADNAGGTNASFITVLVTNVPPVANPDFYTVAENSSADVLSPLANDQVNTSGGVLGLVRLSPTNGTAAISGTNILFTPQANFAGTATIGYTLTDNVGGTNSSLITVTVANPSADLSLSASAAPQPVGVNSNLVYSIIVTNLGPSAATGVVVSNQLPVGVNFVSATGGATPSGGVLLLNLGSLAEGAVTNAQVIVQPTSAGNLTNLFQVFANETDPVLTNNSTTLVSMVTNAPANGADLSLSASAAPEPVGEGSNLVYSLTVSNAGPAAATGVVVNNQLPVGVTFVSATGGGTPSDGILLVNLGSLANGAVTNAQVIVQPPSAGQLTNLFQVFANETDPVLTNNSAMVVSTVTNAPAVAQADLSLGGTNSAVATYTDNLIYNLSVTNLGPDAATGVVISNQIPAGIGFVSATDGATPTNGILLLNLGGLAAGAVTNVTINLTPTNYPLGFFTNVFQVSANETDPISSNNSAAFITQIRLPTTEFSSSSAEYDTNQTTTVSQQLTNYSTELIAKLPNGTVVYDQTFTAAYSDPSVQLAISTAAGALTNAGAAAYTGPAQTGFSQTTNQTSATVPISTNITVIVGTKQWVGPVTFPAGNFGIVTGYTFDPVATNYAIPTGGNPGSFTLTAGQTDFDTMVLSIIDILLTATNTISYTNSSVYTMTGVVAQADLQLSASAAPEPVVVGSNLVYSITISNAGPDAANGVVISNQLPAGVGFVSATGGVTPTNGLLLLNLGSIASGATNAVQVILRPTSAGDLTNLFQVFADETDPMPSNNVAAVVNTVANPAPIQADLSLLASTAPQPVGVNSNLVYTIIVTNLGPSAATGVVVSNQVPANVSFVSATGGATPSGGILLVNLGSLAEGATNSIQIVVQPTAAGKLTNLFQVFATTADPVLTNNSATVVSTVTNPPPAQADLSVTVGSGNYVTVVGQSLTFFVTVSNFGPATATGVVLSNPIPANEIFSSVTGGSTPSNGVLLLELGTLAAGADTNLSVVVYPTLPPGQTSGFILSQFQVFGNQPDPDTTNNISFGGGPVVVPPVDVALSLMAAPNPVAVGAPLTYSLSVTNNSTTTATNVVVTDTLPVNVSLFSLLPSEGSASNQAGVVTYNVGSLPNGIVATLAIVVLPNVPGLLTNIAVAFSTQTDSQPANNAVTNVTTAVTVPITNLVLTVISPMTLNPQTGLFEQKVEVSNGGLSTPSSVMVLVSGLAVNATLYNAAGVTNGTPFVQSAAPLGVGSNVVFLLEYYVPTRVAPTNLTLTVEAGPVVIPPAVNGTILSISRPPLVLSNGSVLVEFSAVPGQVYAIQYSSDMQTWLTAVPAITAPANQVQWIDSGPPKTVSSPAQQGSRYYRVVLLPAN